MKRKSWIKGLLALLVLTVVYLPAGCSDKKESSVERSKKKVVNKGSKMVKLQTSMGDIVIELNEKAAPVTVANFLKIR